MTPTTIITLKPRGNATWFCLYNIHTELGIVAVVHKRAYQTPGTVSSTGDNVEVLTIKAKFNVLGWIQN